MNTATTRHCPRCDSPIPPEAPQGLCPKCLLAAVSLGTEAGHPAEPGGIPSVEAVAGFFPHLEILEFVGQGGMGLVFKARQRKLERLVALKLLPQKPGADPAFGERFNREARVLAKLSHPNIVAVHDFGEAGPFFYLLMEFVDGVNLRQAMRAGRFTPEQALALVPRICDALQYAHEEGVLHRDIKPENLLLDTRGRLKIADFGIAKLIGEAPDITLTASGAAIGTPHYMAPEQLERPQEVDQRADVYSLGVVFYEMLTGELPIGRFAPPSEKAPMDPRVDEVVLRTLEKERERRFQTAGDVKTQVEKITAGPTFAENTRKSPEETAKPVEPPVGRQPAWSAQAWGAAGLVLFSLLASLPLLAGGVHGSGEALFMLLLAGLPAVAGTALAWLTLSQIKARKLTVRGAKLALITAVAWPLFLVNTLALIALLVSAETFQWCVLRLRSGGILGFAAVVDTLVLLALNGYALRRWFKRWNAFRELPHEELVQWTRRLPRRAIWAPGLGLAVFVLVLMVSHRRIEQMRTPESVSMIQLPNVPPEFEASPGGPPSPDGSTYHSQVFVPAGYALTMSTVLCSNQTVLRTFPGESAVLLAPEGSTVQGEVSWRLLGNSMFADGAPLELSLSCGAGPDRQSHALHVMPPESVHVDWVAEPSQLWPPQNGHTRFVLLKGLSARQSDTPVIPDEWFAAVEMRLDPIPAEALKTLKTPMVSSGTNLPSARSYLGTNAPPSGEPEPTSLSGEGSVPALKTFEDYASEDRQLKTLAQREREISQQLTSDDPSLKGIRDRIEAGQKAKARFEEENPGVDRTPMEAPPADANSKP